MYSRSHLLYIEKTDRKPSQLNSPTIHSHTWRKVKQLQPVWSCNLSEARFEGTYYNICLQWAAKIDKNPSTAAATQYWWACSMMADWGNSNTFHAEIIFSSLYFVVSILPINGAPNSAQIWLYCTNLLFSVCLLFFTANFSRNWHKVKCYRSGCY